MQRTKISEELIELCVSHIHGRSCEICECTETECLECLAVIAEMEGLTDAEGN